MKSKNKLQHSVLVYLIFSLIISMLFSSIAFANINIENDLIICPANNIEKTIPDFQSTECSSQVFKKLNPTHTQLWVKANVIVNQQFLDNTPAAGFYVFGKASSLVYFNGVLIGGNGTPGIDKSTEEPGKMDAVIFVPRGLIKLGSNDVVLKMSGHSGFLDLHRPIHWLGLAQYAQPSDIKLRHYWKSIIPLGVLLLGAVYFGIASLRQKEHSLLALMSFFAAAQLCIEIARGLVAYAYPFHDIRLLLILVFSFGFGMAMLLYTLNLLNFKNKHSIALISLALTLTLMIAFQGFDTKSVIAVGLPTTFSLGLSLYCAFRKQTRAFGLALSLSFFVIVVSIAPANFLDLYLFYIVAAFLIILFIQQLSVFANETLARIEEKERADKLQLIIDQNQFDNKNQTLRIKSANKTELISIANISYFKGAGDYVEVALNDSNTLLHNDNLTELEQNLPSTFLRVHRSFIVNTNLISSLERKKSGVGLLTLNNGETVPVSRRIMPSVREQIL